MIVHNFKQLSPEWFKVRECKITASHASSIASQGKGLDSYICQMMAEHYLETEKKEFENEHTIRGNELEDVARKIYELMFDVKVDEVGFIEYNDFVGCSPDGLIGLDEGVEIKAPCDKNYSKIQITEKVNSSWIWQCQMNLLITGRKKWNLIIFNPNFDKAMTVMEILPDKEKFNKLLVGFIIAEQKILSIKDKHNK